MPTVHSVSGITDRLLDIILSKSILQNIRVQGIISPAVGGPGHLLADEDGGNKIRCFIVPPIPRKFTRFWTDGVPAVVHGKIALFPVVNQYQILVNDIQSLKDDNMQNQSLTVSGITTKLSNIIENQSELQDIRVQAKILQGPPGLPQFILTLSDGNSNINAPQIQCALPDQTPQWEVESEVYVRGKIKNFSTTGVPGVRYQIVIDDIDDIELIPFDDEAAKCKCSGCDQCLPLLGGILQCNRPRNSQHELCSGCYAISPDHEKRVEETVEAYFSALNVKGFSSKTQREIQMGSDKRKPDVVLVDGDGSFAAIAECKGAGFIGDGIDQLKSYLSATDTRFGIFANRTDPGQWQFYENRRRNQFDQIDRSKFKEGVVGGITTRNRLSDEIKALESKFNQLESEVDDLETKKARLAKEVEQENRKSDKLKQTIEFDRVYEQDLKSAHKQLESEIDQLRIDKAELKTAVGRFERKERELHAFREQRKEKLQRFETIFNDLKSDLLDLGSPPPPEDNVGPQKPRENKKQRIKNWFKNRFSKENK